MNFLDLFSGIGGFRKGLELSGHKCMGWVECDPFCSRCKAITTQYICGQNLTKCSICEKVKRQDARCSYEAIYNTENEWTAYDITTITTNDIRYITRRHRTIDLICGGFPCQSFSIGGLRKGFSDIRGTMFFEILKFIETLEPKVVLLENVKGLLSHEEGRTFGVILSCLDELGFDVEWEVLNAKDFSLPERPTPQNRERVFIVGHRRGSGRSVFPLERNYESTKIQVIGNLYNGGQAGDVLDPNGISTCLDAMQGGNRMPKIYYNDCNRIKKLSPKECWKLQGFSVQDYEKAASVNCPGALYKQSGNSVNVNVSEAIGKKLMALY